MKVSVDDITECLYPLFSTRPWYMKKCGDVC